MAHEHVLALALLLFAFALAAILLRRNLLVMLVAAEGLFVAAALGLVGFARSSPDPAQAEAFALVALGVAVAQLAVGLALVVAFVRKRGSANVEGASVLRW